MHDLTRQLEMAPRTSDRGRVARWVAGNLVRLAVVLLVVVLVGSFAQAVWTQDAMILFEALEALVVVAVPFYFALMLGAVAYLPIVALIRPEWTHVKARAAAVAASPVVVAAFFFLFEDAHGEDRPLRLPLLSLGVALLYGLRVQLWHGNRAPIRAWVTGWLTVTALVLGAALTLGLFLIFFSLAQRLR